MIAASTDNWLGLTLVGLTIGYLVYVLFHPERF